MGQIILPKVFSPGFSNPRIKPIGNVRVDWGDSITNGLIKLYFETDAGILDLVNNRLISNPTTTAVKAVFQQSRMRDYNGVNLEYDAITSFNAENSSIGFCGVLDNDTSDAFTALGSSTNNNPIILVRVQGGFLSSFSRSSSGSGGNEVTVTESIATNELIKGTVTHGNARKRVYYNQTPLASTATNLTAGVDVDRIGFAGLRRSSDGDQANCKLALVWLFNRELSEGEVRNLHANPYKLIKPAIPVTYFIPSAGAPPATSIPVIMNYYAQQRAS